MLTFGLVSSKLGTCMVVFPLGSLTSEDTTPSFKIAQNEMTITFFYLLRRQMHMKSNLFVKPFNKA